jgi:hypothetical protein
MLDQDFEIFGKHSLSWAAGTGTSASNIAAWAAAVDASHDTLGFALGLVYTQWVFSAADLSGLLVAADYAWNHRHRTNYTVTNYTNYTPDVVPMAIKTDDISSRRTGRLGAAPATAYKAGLKSDDEGSAPSANHTVSQIWQHGEGGCLCVGIPALIHTRSQTILAFAECRMWKGDGCFPKTAAPVPPANFSCRSTCIVAKRSADGGKSWSSQHLVTHAGGNVMPVWDDVRGRVVLNFALGHASDPPYIEATAGTYSTIGSTDSEQILSAAAWSAPRRIAQYPGGWASQPGPG